MGPTTGKSKGSNCFRGEGWGGLGWTDDPPGLLELGSGGSVRGSLRKRGSQNVARPPHLVKTFCEIP